MNVTKQGFLTWLQIGNPIQSQIWKFFFTKTEFYLEIFLVNKVQAWWFVASYGETNRLSHWQCCRKSPGGWFNIKMPSYQYRKSHCGDKTIVNIKMPSYQYRESHCGDKTILRSSYLHNGISYTGKMASLYWIRALTILGTSDSSLHISDKKTFDNCHKYEFAY